jgi:hypothetical protein
MHQPTLLLSLTFAAFALLVAALAARSLRSPWLAVWICLTGGLAASGWLATFNSFPPPLMRLILPALLLTTIACLRFDWYRRFSLAGLVAFQSFRLPLELIMHQAAREGVMPPQMTFTGRNWDILTGLLALPLAYLLSRNRARPAWVWAWNLLGLLLLINVVSVAVMSFPGPLRRFWNEPANLWVTHLPFVWLPTVLVPLALAGHLLIARKLLSGCSTPEPSSLPAAAYQS